MDPQLVKKSVISDDHNCHIIVCQSTSGKQCFPSAMIGKSHKKRQMPHIANCIKCMNIDSEREDTKEMSKEKDLLDMNNTVGFFLILI